MRAYAYANLSITVRDGVHISIVHWRAPRRGKSGETLSHVCRVRNPHMCHYRHLRRRTVYVKSGSSGSANSSQQRTREDGREGGQTNQEPSRTNNTHTRREGGRQRRNTSEIAYVTHRTAEWEGYREIPFNRRERSVLKYDVRER